jgi:hypothetical protein
MAEKQSTKSDAKPLAEPPGTSARPAVKSMRFRSNNPELPTPRISNEAKVRRIIVYGSLIAFALTAILVSAALLQLFVLAPREAVATVGGVDITKAELQNRTKLEYASISSQYNRLSDAVQQAQAQGGDQAGFLAQFYQQQLQQLALQIDPAVIARNSLNNLIGERLIRQEAAARGITINPDDVQLRIEDDIGYFRAPKPDPTPSTPGATPEPAPTSIPEAQFQDGYKRGVDYFKSVGLSEQDFRGSYELRMIEEKLREDLVKDLPKQDLQYKFDYVRFNNQAAATDAVARLNSGAVTMPALISATNAITENIPGNGDSIDWSLKKTVEGRFDADLVKALDTAEIGKVTTVFSETAGSFYVAQLGGREVRALSAADLDAQKRATFDEWLRKAQDDPAKVANKSADIVNIVPKNIRDQIAVFKQNLR